MASPQDFGFRKPIIPVLPCLPIQILLKCKDSDENNGEENL
jgi:hypothetical protein